MARIPRPFVCENCGKTATSQHENPKFCCRACASRNYRKRAHGPNTVNWKGGRRLTSEGYVQLYTGVKTTVLEHRKIAERVLGRSLPPAAIVHHIDGDESNNATSNLVILENHAEHVLLHHKQRRLRDTGSLQLRRCGRCGIVKALSEFNKRPQVWDGARSECKSCERTQRKLRRRP